MQHKGADRHARHPERHLCTRQMKATYRNTDPQQPDAITDANNIEYTATLSCCPSCVITVKHLEVQLMPHQQLSWKKGTSPTGTKWCLHHTSMQHLDKVKESLSTRPPVHKYHPQQSMAATQHLHLAGGDNRSLMVTFDHGSKPGKG